MERSIPGVVELVGGCWVRFPGDGGASPGLETERISIVAEMHKGITRS